MNNKDSLEDVLFNAIQSYSITNTVWVAFSGGIDSSVLLHALIKIKSRLTNRIGAIHVNHKLNKDSDEWQTHCKNICRDNDIEFKAYEVAEKPEKNESIEAWARSIRYQAFSEVCCDDDLVLTAQHQDDQAETILLQLLRGAGPKGLSAMPKLMHKHNYYLGRPFLAFEKYELEAYAKNNNIQWVNDTSNVDTRFDRNYLRNSIFPSIKKRWPAAVKTLNRSSVHIGELVDQLNQKTQIDLNSIISSDCDVINIDGLKKFSYSEQKHLIRTWIDNNNYILPSEAILEQILKNVINCEEDKMPLVRWQNVDVRRYKNKLYIMESLGEINNFETDWNIMNSIELDYGSLTASLEIGKGIKTQLINNNNVQIKFRKGGETIRPFKRNNKHELKKLLQEAEVLPWVRDKIPLIYINNELVLVSGFWVSNEYACLPEEKGWDISWDSQLRLTA